MRYYKRKIMGPLGNKVYMEHNGVWYVATIYPGEKLVDLYFWVCWSTPDLEEIKEHYYLVKPKGVHYLNKEARL